VTEDPPLKSVELAPQERVMSQYGVGMLEQANAVRRRLDTARSPLEESYAVLGLERRDVA
jgi:hypothetical protein